VTDDDGRGGLAAERTALAWNRTGMALLVAGAVLLRLFPPGDDLLRGGVAGAMVGAGVVTAAAGWRARGRPAAERAVRRLAFAMVLLSLATAVAALVP
jgi:uncharacterized membrane protein YidH (DUF202 family)